MRIFCRAKTICDMTKSILLTPSILLISYPMGIKAIYFLKILRNLFRFSCYRIPKEKFIAIFRLVEKS